MTDADITNAEMASDGYETWLAANQRYLFSAVNVVRGFLERKLAELGNKDWDATVLETAMQELEVAAALMPAPATLDRLCIALGLTEFERNLLLLCVGIELDDDIADFCAAIHGDDAMDYPTMKLASVLPGADWRALSSQATLRHWRLIEMESTPGFTTSAFSIDENMLFFLTGVPYIDRRMEGIVHSLTQAERLAPSHQQLADRVVQTWAETAGTADEPVVQLCGSDLSAKRSLALATCQEMGLQLDAISASYLPTNALELLDLMRLWDREAFLHGKVLLLECDRMKGEDAAQVQAIETWVDRCRSFLFLSTMERRSFPQSPVLCLDVGMPTMVEQHQRWQEMLGEVDLQLGDLSRGGYLDRMVFQFNLSYPSIRAICAGVKGQVTAEGKEDSSVADVAESFWQTCRVQARPKLDDLVQRIEPAAVWQDLVLPNQQLKQLREIALQMRQRSTVYESWGFSSKSKRGLGISAMFAGPSGTGKTMAAEVLAKELQLDLYRIDLSTVVNKYIGETEKNLGKVFDAAEAGGAVLLFDEADALFGKRSDVKDSRDRYANLEVSYLLQRMEDYRGIAILTTNLKDSLDSAFLRRLRFIINFPFPDLAQRQQIWQRIFPDTLPLQGLSYEKLAKLSVSGGIIRNIAVRAAFTAAGDSSVLEMKHIFIATQMEYLKLDRTLTDIEIGIFSNDSR